MNETMYFKDENGNELPLTMIDAFEFESQQYALFATPAEDLKDDEEPSLYIMKPIISNDEITDFEMPTDEEMEAVTPFLISRLESRHSCSGSCSSCGGCGCGDDDCGCGDDDDCGDDHGCDCGCGCH